MAADGRASDEVDVNSFLLLIERPRVMRFENNVFDTVVDASRMRLLAERDDEIAPLKRIER